MGILSISDPIDDFEVDEDETLNRDYSTTHVVTVSDSADSTRTILADPLCPQPHITTPPWDDGVKCRRRRLTAWEDGYTWMLRVTWSSKMDFEQPDTDPLARPVKGAVRCVNSERPVFADGEGRPLVNSAGDIYRGMMATGNVFVVDVTTYFTSWPIALLRLNNSINAGAVTMFGIPFPARTCWLQNVVIPEDPTEENGRWYWRVPYEVHVDGRGYFTTLPNAGRNKIVYQTRANENAAWEDVPYSDYDEKTPTSDRRYQKRRCLDGVQNDVDGDTWLDRYGQETQPAFGTGPIATAAATGGSDVITASADVFAPENVGVMITLGAQEPFSEPSQLVITEVLNSTDVRVNRTALASFSGVPLTVAGCVFNAFSLQAVRDWSTLPLPPVPLDLSTL
jgi:hypothetical protein